MAREAVVDWSVSSTGDSIPAGQRDPEPDPSAWKAIVRKYQEPSLGRAIWQLVNTLGPYTFLWYLLYRSLAWSYWLTVAFAILAGLFLVRIFIIFHDCGHGSFFKSRLANDVVGFITGVLTLTPYYHWRWEHSIHHASAGDLDRRGTGDVWTMTVEEYLKSSRWKRFAYRLAHNPFVLFGLAPIYLFVIQQRFSSSKASPREVWSVRWMNLAILGVAAALTWAFGIVAYVLIQLTIVMVGGGVGSGCSMCSINLKTCIGSAMSTGIARRPPCGEVPSTNCRRSSSGSRATSAFTISTISVRESRTTTSSAGTRQTPCFKRSSRSPSSPV